MIKDLTDGSNASGIYLVKDFAKCLTNGGKAYLNLHFQDGSGVIDGKKWDVTNEDLATLEIGGLVRVDGTTLDYKGKLQIKVLGLYKVDPNDADLEGFLLQSPIPVETLIAKFKKHYASVKNEDCKLILKEIFTRYYKEFIDYPAAVKNHHEFYHGLIYHTVSMCDIADFLCTHYPELNRDLLISGCLLHDIGKVIELSGPIATKYTEEGTLLGHLTIGMSLVKEIADQLNIKSEVPMLLEHMILSHHGKLEFGAAVLPLTREALILSMIDDMDAKMMMLDKAYKDVEEGNYTERLFGLDNRAFYKSKIK